MTLTRLVLSLLMVSASLAATASARAQHLENFVYDETLSIPGVEEREITFYLDRPKQGEPVPLLLLVDGSSCIGQQRPSWADKYRPSPDTDLRYARLRVEKPGVSATDDYPSECNEEFSRHYTMDNRVFDHLRVLQHLEANADWWNGELHVWGWSDGGDVAAQLVIYRPTIERAVLGASGGGYTMAEHFEDYFVCAEDRTDDREACIAELRRLFAQIEDNPTWTKTWSGQDNSHATWATRLRSRLSAPLADNRVPILIVHGELDRDGTPVQSARKLVEDLKAAENDAFAYWEIAQMGHGPGALSQTDQDKLSRAMLDWLFEKPIEPGDLPPLTDHQYRATDLLSRKHWE